MDDWQAQLAGTLDRALNAAIDIRVMQETGLKTGSLAPSQTGPSWFPTWNQPNVSLRPGQAGTPIGAAAGMPQWVPAVLIVGALGLLVWKLAK